MFRRGRGHRRRPGHADASVGGRRQRRPDARLTNGNVDLNLRAWPTPQSQLLVKIPQGTRVEADRCIHPEKVQDDWCHVRYDGYVGWVNAAFLQEIGSGYAGPPPPTVEQNLEREQEDAQSDLRSEKYNPPVVETPPPAQTESYRQRNPALETCLARARANYENPMWRFFAGWATNNAAAAQIMTHNKIVMCHEVYGD
jgi:hypothetical protein